MARISSNTKRKAAGYVLLGAFHTAHAVAASLDHVRGELRKGLTDKEAEFLDRRYELFRDQAEILRKLGWRLIRSA